MPHEAVGTRQCGTIRAAKHDGLADAVAGVCRGRFAERHSVTMPMMRVGDVGVVVRQGLMLMGMCVSTMIA